ncbi:MAG TPA: hypothetical protein PKC89_08620 [Pyrinomonadaceae bacterium]|nr:hypothetical protein [Pyrinomonadaceae bacterium]
MDFTELKAKVLPLRVGALLVLCFTRSNFPMVATRKFPKTSWWQFRNDSLYRLTETKETASGVQN